MQVYLFRHGQKDNLPFEDPDLTSYGRQQALHLAARMREGDFLLGTQFLASPRLRARNTLAPAATMAQLPVLSLSDLDQRTALESRDAFRSRVQKFLRSLEAKFTPREIIYLCSHHDWIDESMSCIPSDTDLTDARYSMWRPAQFMHFEIHDGLWHLQRFDQVEAL